jgi:hypothetical protein
LRIVQGAVRRNSARTPAAPPAPEELRALDQSLDAILDPELRAELAKLGRGVLARTRRTKPPQP